MHAPQPSQHLERIRRATAYPALRLLVDIAAKIAALYLIYMVVEAFKLNPWIALHSALSFIPIFVARGLALALLDIADLQLRQGLLNETARATERAEPPA